MKDLCYARAYRMARCGAPVLRCAITSGAMPAKEGILRILIVLVVACLGVAPTTFAQSTHAATQAESKPSEASIRHLLDVMQARQIVQTLSVQMDAMFDNLVNKQLEGQNPTPEQQKAIEARRDAARDMVKNLLSWDSMEHLYLKVYEDTFSQQEIDGMTAFYASPTGQAVIAKMPLAMKNSMSEMQERVKDMIPKIQQMAKEAAEQVKNPAPKKSG
jgi:uncharacterized protein